MTTYYLCESQAEINGQDYGRRKVVRCSSGCKYYEIDNVALSKMESTDFPAIMKSALLKTVREIANRGGEAEIVFDGTTITAREKQS